jgi:hypothetical protein
LDAKADVIVFIDHDLSWRPNDLLKLVETEGDVVAGTYRFKREPEEYMGRILTNSEGRPIQRSDGCISAFAVPAGFLKITTKGLNTFIEHYPELCYGERHSPHVDLFNHGAHKHMWYGEDYAFCRNWIDTKNPIWLVPDLTLTHHGDKEYRGNYHEYLLGCPGGSNSTRRMR